MDCETGASHHGWLKKSRGIIASLRCATTTCFAFVIAVMLALTPSPSAASESVSYCYDALGRLTQVGKTGGPASGKKTTTTYDAADNRSNQTTTTGTIDCTASGGGGGPPGPSFSINDAIGTEGETLVFTVTKTGSTTSTYSVDYATANGTATGADYTAASGTLTFAPTQMTKMISVVTRTDFKVEPNETFYVNLSNPTNGATISDGQGIGTLFNDDSVCLTCRPAGTGDASEEAPSEEKGK